MDDSRETSSIVGAILHFKTTRYSKLHKILFFNCAPSVVRLEELLFLSLSL